MRVLVTGGSGKAGSYAVRELLSHGHQVTNADIRPSIDSTATWKQVELTDMGQVYGALVGHDAVLHLASQFAPIHYPPEVVFRNNALAAFNVVEAAATLGLRRIVIASSDSILGFSFATRPFAPEYLPIDEQHPIKPQDPYGLSKLVGEETCQMVTRRTGIPTVALRFSWIQRQEDYANRFPPFWEAPEKGLFNLWSYVDARDVGVACRLALEANTEGFEAFYIAAADSTMNIPTRELIAHYLPEVTRLAEGWGGHEPVLDSSKAARMLGYKPAYSWRNHIQIVGWGGHLRV